MFRKLTIVLNKNLTIRTILKKVVFNAERYETFFPWKSDFML